ncbi:MAG: hypothetical protein LBD79_02465 [Treponema sp.]|jgi:tRNA U34 2-thiouridine synthase MnmA/TrmU|nr:hypothetical protein [Treponema sp.]
MNPLLKLGILLLVQPVGREKAPKVLYLFRRYSNRRYQLFPSKGLHLDDPAQFVRIEFDVPQRAITTGQVAVCYDGDTVICGGVIVSSIP